MSDRSGAKIGIILMAYNQGRYLNEAIESLKLQTYQNFEVHLVDDGSNDGETPEILKKTQYAKITKKFLYKTNIGTAKRQFQQYKIMNNEYIMILCADDKLSPTFLEKTQAYMEKHSKCGAVGTDIVLFYDDLTPPVNTEFNHQYMALKHILGKNHMLGSSLMRKKALDESDLSGGFVRYQDWDRWVSMLEAGWELGLISEPLFYYRQHNSSLSHTASIESEMEIREKMLNKHQKAYRENYKQVILDIYKNLLEVQEGKNWLEQQYFNMSKEIERLNSIIETNNKPCSLSSRIKGKIKRVIKRK